LIGLAGLHTYHQFTNNRAERNHQILQGSNGSLPGVGRKDAVYKASGKIDTMNEAAGIQKYAVNSKAIGRRLKSSKVPADCREKLVDSAVVRLDRRLAGADKYIVTRTQPPAKIDYAWQVEHKKKYKPWAGTRTFTPKKDYFEMSGDLYTPAVVYGMRHDSQVQIWCSREWCNDGDGVRMCNLT